MPALSSSDLRGHHVGSDQYAAMLASCEARVPQPRARLVCTSLTLDNSKLNLPLHPSTQHVDFVAIADSSTGGNGLPRPYGRFGAARHGDGTAVWERSPPEKTLEWHAKLFGALAAQGRAVIPAKQQQQQQARDAGGRGGADQGTGVSSSDLEGQAHVQGQGQRVGWPTSPTLLVRMWDGWR